MLYGKYSSIEYRGIVPYLPAVILTSIALDPVA